MSNQDNKNKVKEPAQIYMVYSERRDSNYAFEIYLNDLNQKCLLKSEERSLGDKDTRYKLKLYYTPIGKNTSVKLLMKTNKKWVFETNPYQFNPNACKFIFNLQFHKTESSYNQQLPESIPIDPKSTFEIYLNYLKDKANEQNKVVNNFQSFEDLIDQSLENLSGNQFDFFITIYSQMTGKNERLIQLMQNFSIQRYIPKIEINIDKSKVINLNFHKLKKNEEIAEQVYLFTLFYHFYYNKKKFIGELKNTTTFDDNIMPILHILHNNKDFFQILDEGDIIELWDLLRKPSIIENNPDIQVLLEMENIIQLADNFKVILDVISNYDNIINETLQSLEGEKFKIDYTSKTHTQADFDSFKETYNTATRLKYMISFEDTLNSFIKSFVNTMNIPLIQAAMNFCQELVNTNNSNKIKGAMLKAKEALDIVNDNIILNQDNDNNTLMTFFKDKDRRWKQETFNKLICFFKYDRFTGDMNGEYQLALGYHIRSNNEMVFKAFESLFRITSLLQLDTIIGIIQTVDVNDKFLELFTATFSQLFLKENHITNQDTFKTYIKRAISFIFFNQNNEINLDNPHFAFLKNYFNKDITKLLFIDLLNDYEYHVKSIDFILQFLIDNSTSLELLSHLKRITYIEALQKLFHNKLNYSILIEEDFYTEQQTQRLLFYQYLIDQGFYEKNYSPLFDTNYYVQTKKTIQNIINPISNDSIKYSEMNILLNFPINQLKERIKYITHNMPKEEKILIDKVTSYQSINEQQLRPLDEVISFVSNFRKYQVNDLNALKTFKVNMVGMTLREILNSKNIFELTKRYKQQAYTDNILIKSKIWSSIVSSNQTEDEKKKYEENINNYKSFESLYTANGLEKIPKNLLPIIYKQIKNKEDIDNELDILSKYFGKSFSNKAEITQSLLVLSSKKIVYQTAKNVAAFINNIEVKKTAFYENLIEFIGKEADGYNIVLLKKVNTQLLSVNIDINRPDNILNVIIDILGKKKGLFELLNNMPVDINEMTDFIDEGNNYTMIKPSHIDQLKQVKLFTDDLNIKPNQKTEDVSKIKALDTLLQKNKYPQLTVSLEATSQNIDAIKEIAIGMLDTSQFFKNKVMNISDSSEYIIDAHEDKYRIRIFYEDKSYSLNKKKNKTIKKEIDLKELLQLKEKSMFLFPHLEKQKLQDNAIKTEIDPKLKKLHDCVIEFHKFIDKILSLFMILEDLQNKGKPKLTSCTVNVIDKQPSINNKSIDDTITSLEKELNELIILQNTMYQDKPLLTFVYGRQFRFFLNFFTYQTNKEQVFQFCNYLTDGKLTSLPVPDIDRLTYDSPNDIIMGTINIYLQAVLKSVKLTEDNIYNDNLIDKSSPFTPGLYKLLLGMQEVPIIIASLYINECKHLPQAHTLLLCNEETTEEEITAFIYRIMTCNGRVLFTILKADRLNLDKREVMINLIKQWLAKPEKQIKATLIFAYFDKGCNLILQLNKTKKCKDIPQEITLQKSLEKYCPNIEIIQSDAAGVGKSTKIREDANNNTQSYIYFPFGGDFNKNDMITRLKKEFTNKGANNTNKIVFHLDMHDTRKDQDTKDFLFLFLITKMCYNCEHIFYQNKSIIIKIEIPFGFVKYSEKFPILQLFKTTTMSKNALPPLLISNDIDSNVQIVANYLQLIELSTEKNCNLQERKVLSQKICQELIFKTFKDDCKNYYQITSFINSFGNQLSLLSINSYLSVDQLTDIGRAKGQMDLPNIRRFIIESFIKITQYFTKGAYNDLINNQNCTYRSQEYHYNENNANEKAIDLLTSSNQNIIQFKDISPSLFFINKDYQSFSIISTIKSDTTDKDKVAEWNSLYRVWNSGESKKSKEIPIVDYKNLEEEKNADGFWKEIIKVFDIKKTHEAEIREKCKSYVFTSDNFIKLILILLRERAKIPVILMGETGVGKTCLIENISKLNRNKIKTMNIHAGISDEDIVIFMKSVIDDLKISKDKSKDYKYWVFLDEINTCHSMGLISEMMCKHTMLGETIPDEIVFVAACNPYKISKTPKKNVGLKDDEVEKSTKINLVYSVNPLPHSLLNFVFNFGSLNDNDEKKYIISMIRPPINDVCTQLKEEFKEYMINQTKNAITFAQSYIRKNNGNASVSLRDIKRFNIFFTWFYNYLMKKTKIVKNAETDEYDYSRMTPEEIIKDSIILGLYICYYIRITEKKLQKEFLNSMLETYNFDLIKTPFREENDIIERINLPRGIARNRALLQNVFCLFVCLNTKIPLFICGKPGCSKTLSVQLLFKAMRGEGSENDFFKQYPQVYKNCYQGSSGSTSAGVLQVFNKARKVIEDYKNPQSIISLVFFDEMGLAERSPNNPLKVIHSELEYEGVQNQKAPIAFVGISNWELDAAKMNRGVFLAIHDPDEPDLQKTAITIAESYDKRLRSQFETYLSDLASTYYKYKERLLTRSKYEKEFHGTRDFYYLIKTFSKKLLGFIEAKTNDQTIQIAAIESIERNFGGLTNSIKTIKEIFKEKYPSFCKADENYKVMKCITDNIKEEKSRYLIVVSKGSLSPYLIENIIDKEIKRQFLFYIGSEFTDDLNEEYYGVKILNKIQTCMEQGTLIILKNLKSIYASLYDVFNQNFNIIGGKKYARIAVGSTNNSMAEVNDKFFCIILLDQEELQAQDDPFLNRFEKHIVKFEYLLEKRIKVSEDIYENIRSFGTPNQKAMIFLNLDKQFINCDLSEIQGILYQKIKTEPNIENQQMINEIIYKIAPTLSQDLIAVSTIATAKVKYNVLFKAIIDRYKQCEHRSIIHFIKSIQYHKNIVYTFSHILDKIEIDSKASIDSTIGRLLSKNITEEFLSSAQTENQLESLINKFYKNPEKKVGIFKFSLDDCKHLNHFKYILDNYEKENMVVVKYIIILIYIERDFRKGRIQPNDDQQKLNIHLISHLSAYSQTFIDDINGNDLKLTDIINQTSKEMIANEKFFNGDKIIDDNVYSSFNRLKVTNVNKGDGNFVKNVIKAIIDNKSNIKTHIKKCIVNNISNDYNVIEKIFKNNIITSTAYTNSSFVSVIYEQLSTLFETYLTKFLFKCERDNSLNAMIFNEQNRDSIKLFEEYIDKIILDNVMISARIEIPNEVKIIHGLRFPLSKIIFDSIMINKESLRDSYYNNEVYIRSGGNSETDQELKNIYINEENKKMLSLHSDFKNIPWLRNLVEKYDNHTLKDDTIAILYEDYFKKYIAENFNETNEGIIGFFAIMINIRFKERTNKDAFKQLARMILWVEANDYLIKIILQCFIDLSVYHPDLLTKVYDSLPEIKYEISERSLEYTKEVNEVFTKSIEVLLLISTSNITTLLKMQENEWSEYLKLLKRLVDSCTQIESALVLICKEKIGIAFMIDFNETIMPLGNYDRKTVLMNLDYDKREREVMKNNDHKNLEILLTEQYKFIAFHLQETIKFEELTIKYLVGKCRKFPLKDYRLKVLDIMISNNKFIKKGYVLIKLFFDSYALPTDFTDNEINELTDSFMDFTYEDKEAFGKIETKDNEVLNQLLLFFFQTQFNNYFFQLLNLQQYENKNYKILLGLNLKYFKKSLDYLDMYNKKQTPKKVKYPKLALFYSVSFIKVYTFHLVKIVMKPNNVINELKDFLTIISTDSKINRVIMIYIFKILRSHYNSFEQFLNQAKVKLPFTSRFDFDDKVKSVLDTLFISINDLNQFENCHRDFIAFSERNFTNAEKNLLIKNGNYVFYDVSINKIVSNYQTKDYFRKDIVKSFMTWATAQLTTSELTPDSKDLLKLIYDKATIEEKFLPLINNKNNEDFELILYSLKMNLMCTEAGPNSFYRKFASKNGLDALQNSYVPGREPNESLLINSCEEIEDYLNQTNHPSNAAYICNCLHWYAIDPCGLPGFKKGEVLPKCSGCGLDITGYDHVLVDRPGHYRIYKDESQRKNVEGRGYYKTLPFKMLNVFKKEVKKEIDENFKGMKTITEAFFVRKNKTIRELDQITYRILNFILYSVLYFSSSTKLIDSNKIKQAQILVANKTCLEILQKNWTILKEELKAKQVHNIQIFFNHITMKLAQLMKECTGLASPNERKAFEDKAKALITERLSTYQKASVDYMKKNNDILQVNPLSTKSIINESEDPDKFIKEEFPFMPYFQLEKYPDVDFIERLLNTIPNHKTLYPIISSYFFQRYNVPVLDNFSKINPFCNAMIKNYSYQIDRAEAKTLIIQKELKDDNSRRMFKKFKEGWENIKEKVIKYKCRPEMKPFTITESSPIAYTLNDDGELYYGMYIASAYQLFLETQNTFLNSILEQNHTNKISHYFSKSVSKEMKIQDATKNEIVSFNIKTNDYNGIEDIFSTASMRNCLNAQDKVDYKNYQNVTIDLDRIEYEMGKVFLSGKRLFSESQRFVTFNYEGYNGEKTVIIENFIKKYSQIPLTVPHKNALNDYSRQTNKIENFLFSLQMLISYLLDETIDKKTSIRKLIQSLPSYIKVKPECNAFFLKEGNETFTIEHIIDINDYIEKMSYIPIVENVNDEYKQPLSEAQINAINQYFNSLTPDKIVTREILADASRKFVSRFICGRRLDNSMKLTEYLISLLICKEELWPKDIFNNDDFSEECTYFPFAITVTVEQAVSFTDVLIGAKKQQLEIVPKQMKNESILPIEQEDEPIIPNANPKKRKRIQVI